MVHGAPRYCKYITRQKDLGFNPLWLDNSYNETMKADHWKTMMDIATGRVNSLRSLPSHVAS